MIFTRKRCFHFSFFISPSTSFAPFSFPLPPSPSPSLPPSSSGQSITIYQHTSSVYCIDALPNSSHLFAAATEDGSLYIIDSRSPQSEKLNMKVVIFCTVLFSRWNTLILFLACSLNCIYLYPFSDSGHDFG